MILKKIFKKSLSLFCNNNNNNNNNNNCRDKGLKLYIGPWVLTNDVDWFEDD